MKLCGADTWKYKIWQNFLEKLHFRSAPEVKRDQISPKCQIFPEALRCTGAHEVVQKLEQLEQYRKKHLKAHSAGYRRLHISFELNPRPAGGAQRAPLWFFANSSWSTGNFALKLAIPLRTTIPLLVSKNYDPGHNRSAVSDVRVTSCFADFDQQNGFTGIAATGAVLKLRSIDLYEMT